GKALSDFIEEWQAKGEWRIWEIEGELAGITFHIETAPSNGKPWLGTILVNKSMRGKGIARSMIQSLSRELKDKGYSALFAGIPISQYTWAEFVSRCGFEQLKTEISDEVTYLILIRPL
uniref:GNAT family N-acetyltransferase n=1 Tax=Enterococcus faecium TaxID=1352 RepID=UPI0030C802D2